MKNLFTVILFLAVTNAVSAQNIYMTKSGKASFFSRSTLVKIEAENNEVSSLFNTQTGDLVFAILLKSFHFSRALMEEHFNENYVESDKFPKSTFKGKIAGPSLASINFSKDGIYPVVVEGSLTIHGIPKDVVAPGSMSIKSGKISAVSKFSIKLKDYNISIPSLVADKISEDIDIKIDCQYELKNPSN